MTRFRRQSERRPLKKSRALSRSHLELCFAVLVVTLVFNSFGAAPSDQSRDIAAHWSDYWNAISDLEVESEEFQVASREARAAADQPTYKYQFLLGSGGKRALPRRRNLSRRGSGPASSTSARTVAKPTSRLNLQTTRTPRKRSQIKPQVDTHEDYKGPMSSFLAVDPGGASPPSVEQQYVTKLVIYIKIFFFLGEKKKKTKLLARSVFTGSSDVRFCAEAVVPTAHLLKLAEQRPTTCARRSGATASGALSWRHSSAVRYRRLIVVLLWRVGRGAENQALGLSSAIGCVCR